MQEFPAKLDVAHHSICFSKALRKAIRFCLHTWYCAREKMGTNASRIYLLAASVKPIPFSNGIPIKICSGAGSVVRRHLKNHSN